MLEVISKADLCLLKLLACQVWSGGPEQLASSWSLHASAEPYNMLSNGTVVSASSQTFFQDDAQSTATGDPTPHGLECGSQRTHCP